MPYFSNMPTIQYPTLVDGKVKFVNSRNILVRAKIIDYIKNSHAGYLSYTIRDGERPETLANRIYGQADLHWLILLFNEIIDPMFEWPLSEQQLLSAVERKYTGKTIFVDLKSSQYSKNGVVGRSSEQMWYEVGGEVRQGFAVGRVLSWDPNLYKIVIKQTSTANFLKTPGVTNPFSDIRDLVHERSDGFTIFSKVGRVVDDNKYAVNRFEDSDTGEVLDHHEKDMTRDNEIIGVSLLDQYAIYDKEIISTANRTAVAISNYKHEMDVNESKRRIKIMRPELIDVIVKDLRRIFFG